MRERSVVLGLLIGMAGSCLAAGEVRQDTKRECANAIAYVGGNVRGAVTSFAPCTLVAISRALVTSAVAFAKYSWQTSNSGLPSILKSGHAGGLTGMGFAIQACSGLESSRSSDVGTGFVGLPIYVTPSIPVTCTMTGGAPVR